LPVLRVADASSRVLLNAEAESIAIWRNVQTRAELEQCTTIIAYGLRTAIYCVTMHDMGKYMSHKMLMEEVGHDWLLQDFLKRQAKEAFPDLPFTNIVTIKTMDHQSPTRRTFYSWAEAYVEDRVTHFQSVMSKLETLRFSTFSLFPIWVMNRVQLELPQPLSQFSSEGIQVSRRFNAIFPRWVVGLGLISAHYEFQNQLWQDFTDHVERELIGCDCKPTQ